MQSFRNLIILILIVAGNALGGQSLSPEQQQEISEFIERQVEGVAPGVAVGIVKNGQVILEKYHGYASLQHQVPVDPSTRFNIASVAKQFTALCVLNLILENKLSLEDDIRRYLPAFYPRIDDPIRIRNLLNHSSGIRDFYDLMSIQGDPWWRQEGLDNDDAIDLLAQQQDLNFRPDSAYLYSNSNYTLLTRIVEKVTGQPFPNYAKELFLKIGMTETRFLEDYMHVIPHQALPYSDWGDGIWQQYPMMTNLHGDGFLFTTLRDQITFEQAVQKASTDDQLLTISQQPIPNAAIQHYGYGLEFNEVNGYPSVNHSGGTGSYNAQTMRFPDEKLAIVVMSNNGNIWSGNIARKIAAILLPAGEPGTAAEYPSMPEQVRERSAVQDLIGEYRSPEGTVIRIQLNENEPYWQVANNNPRRLIHESGNRYQLEGDDRVKVVFQAGEEQPGNFTVYFPGSEPRVHPKIPPFAPTLEYLRGLAGAYRSTELGTAFTIEVSADQKLHFQREGKEDHYELELIQEDELLLFDYIIKVERSASGEVAALLITYNRVKNVRFEKVARSF